MTPSLDSTILLLGGTGKIASRIAPLLSKNSFRFVCASRSGNPPAGTAYPSCQFDWLDASTYCNPFNYSPNISSVFLVAPQILHVFPPMKAFIDFAIARQVTRFVLVSAYSAPIGGPMMGQVHEYLVQVGVEYTVLRPPWFMENFSEQRHRVPIRDFDKIFSATGKGKAPFISVHDIAAVAFRALTDEASHNTDHIISGPELLSYDDIAGTLSKVLQRKITHVNVSEAELALKIRAYGFSEEYAKMVARLDVMISEQKEERLTDTVLKITGKKPRSFEEFARDVKASWEKNLKGDIIGIQEKIQLKNLDNQASQRDLVGEVLWPKIQYTTGNSGHQLSESDDKTSKVMSDHTPS